MTAEEIVLGGYKNFAEGDMDSLSKIYHPKCKITINGKSFFIRNLHRLSIIP